MKKSCARLPGGATTRSDNHAKHFFTDLLGWPVAHDRRGRGIARSALARTLLCAAIAGSLWAGSRAVQADNSPLSLRGAIDARFGGLQWVSAKQLSAWMDGPAAKTILLLDVRTAAEYDVSHLRGAIRVDPDHPRLDRLALPTEQPVVVYCSVGYRSAALAKRIGTRAKAGVFNLEGGLFAWANGGRPIFRGKQRASRVHPYDAIWGRMLKPALRARLPTPLPAPASPRAP